MVRIVSICSEIVLLKDLSKRIHLLNKKKKIIEPKGDALEGTEAARYCESPYVEQGGGDVAFGEDEDDTS